MLLKTMMMLLITVQQANMHVTSIHSFCPKRGVPPPPHRSYNIIVYSM